MIKEKVLDLANHISNKKRGSKNEIKATESRVYDSRACCYK